MQPVTIAGGLGNGLGACGGLGGHCGRVGGVMIFLGHHPALATPSADALTPTTAT